VPYDVTQLGGKSEQLSDVRDSPIDFDECNLMPANILGRG